MAIIFNCPSCGKHFEVGDGLAGRRVRCKVCAHEMRIPGESQSSPQSTQSPLLSEAGAKPNSRTKPITRSLPRIDPTPAQADVFGFDDVELPTRGSNLPPMAAPPAARDDPEFGSPWRAPVHMDSQPGKKSGKFDPNEMGPLPRWLAIVVGVFAGLTGIGLIMMIVGEAVSGQTKHVVGALLFFPACALMGLAIVHNLKIMCHAARIGLVHLLAYLFVPFYSLIFIIMYWRATKRSFLLQILGVFGFYGLIILGLVIGGGFESNR